MRKLLTMTAAGVALVAMGACASGSRAGGTPDEFRIVKKAPLTVPPNYQLRPPVAGSSVPRELSDSVVNSVPSAFGTEVGANASAAERALVSAAGANAVSGSIRTQLDYDETKTIRKSRSIADRILFWRSDDPETAEGVDSDNATGGEPVIIQKTNASPRIKLPGT